MPKSTWAFASFLVSANDGAANAVAINARMTARRTFMCGWCSLCHSLDRVARHSLFRITDSASHVPRLLPRIGPFLCATASYRLRIAVSGCPIMHGGGRALRANKGGSSDLFFFFVWSGGRSRGCHDRSAAFCRDLTDGALR